MVSIDDVFMPDETEDGLIQARLRRVLQGRRGNDGLLARVRRKAGSFDLDGRSCSWGYE